MEESDKSEEKWFFEFGNPTDLNPTFLGLEIRLVKDDLIFPHILKVDFWEKSQQILWLIHHNLPIT